MVIKREDPDKVDFSDIDTGELIPVAHPGEFLQLEFLEPLGMSVNALAQALYVPTPRINDVVRGRRAISAGTALRLARYLGTSAQFWMNLQADYDLRIASRSAAEQIKQEIQPLARAKRLMPPKPPRAQTRAAA
jgi:antitoxin HigA-1